jgi:hypothetical protein
VAAVTGRVTCNGQPVKGGSITFSPIAQGKEDPGKAASGTITENGEFRLSTYADNDGAVIGKHRVSFSSDDPYNFPCGQPSTQELEVVAGKNEFNIELSPKK